MITMVYPHSLSKPFMVQPFKGLAESLDESVYFSVCLQLLIWNGFFSQSYILIF